MNVLFHGQRKQLTKLLITSHEVTRLSLLVLLLSGDIETNPGPTDSVYPCGFCDKPVTWNCKGIACDDCNVWFHISCANIDPCDYDALSRSSVAWPCPRCESMNCDSFTFRSYELENQNYFQPLRSISSVSSVSSSNPFSPQKASTPNTSFTTPSPKPKGTHKNPSHTRSCSSSVFELPQKSNLRLMNVNCQGLKSKTQEFATVLQYTKPDIICGTESWLGGVKPGKSPDADHIKSSEIFPDYLNIYRNDRNLQGGGVFILVHKTIISEEKPDLVTDCETEWVKIKTTNQRDLYIGSFYMPKRKKKDLQELQKSINKITDNGKLHKDFIIAGDFNCPDICWQTHTAGSSGEDHKVQQELINIAISTELSQVHLTPTRGPNVLDLVFTTNPSLVKSSTSIPGISDHDIVITDFDVKPYASPQKPRKCFKFGKANWHQMKTELNSLEQEISEEKRKGADVNTLWTTFKDRLQSSIDKNIPTFMLKTRHSLPWITPQLKRMLKKKQRLFKKARSSRNWSGYREFQKHCRRELRRAEWQFINGKISEGLEQKDNKPFWRFIKARKQDSTGVAPLKDKGQLHTDSQTKAAILLDQFKSVFTKASNRPPPTLPQPNSQIDQIQISTEGVVKLLKNLNSGKASGPDNIPNLVLKTLADQLGAPLTIIFQLSLDSGKLPTDWLSANISCAYKKGDRHLASNYRPISLTSVPCKLLEHIICRHLMNQNSVYVGYSKD